MDLSKLKGIGLTDGEIKVYGALLELKECTKTDLVKESKVSPSNIYDITNRLLKKGIISKVKKNGVTHFSPANPKRILDFLETKKHEINEEKKFVNSILPLLMSQFHSSREKVDVEVFQGWNGLKNIFEDLLDECGAGDENFIFGASKGKKEQQTDIFFSQYNRRRAENGIITSIIFNEEMKKRKERIDFLIKSKKYHIKFLPQSTPAEIMVYKNKSCIIILTEDPLVIRITSEEVADSFVQYFKSLWKIAKN
tara:strand:- start:202 stop:960 length:759 start_codon:yes stop_codon:yes gene_type:complete